MLFTKALLILETDWSGKPIGAAALKIDDEDIAVLPKHAHALQGLDPRNALIPVREIASARLSGRRKRGLFCLELRTRDGRDFAFYWASKLTYRKLEEDGGLPQPKRPTQADLNDLRAVLGPVLADETR